MSVTESDGAAVIRGSPSFCLLRRTGASHGEPRMGNPARSVCVSSLSLHTSVTASQLLLILRHQFSLSVKQEQLGDYEMARSGESACCRHLVHGLDRLMSLSKPEKRVGKTFSHKHVGINTCPLGGVHLLDIKFGDLTVPMSFRF